jgi:competence protein ComEC
MPQPFRIPIYKTAPFIRLLLPLIAGVILQWYVQITLAVIVIAAVSFGIAILLFNFLPLALRFKYKSYKAF